MRRYFGRPRSCMSGRSILTLAQRLERHRRNVANLRAGTATGASQKDEKETKEGGAK